MLDWVVGTLEDLHRSLFTESAYLFPHLLMMQSDAGSHIPLGVSLENDSTVVKDLCWSILLYLASFVQ